MGSVRPAITPLHHAGAPALLLFGGSFDPPHAAHTRLARLARDALARREARRVRLVFVPASRSPHKDHAPAPDADRLAMLRLATAPLDDAAIWTDEIDRAAHAPGPSYWVQTLRRAHAAAPRTALHFLIGADQALAFHRWREARAILDLARPVVMPRAPVETRDALLEHLARTDAWDGSALERWRDAWLDLPVLPHTATDVRTLLHAHDEAGGLLDPAVADYIRAHGLYRHPDGGRLSTGS